MEPRSQHAGQPAEPPRRRCPRSPRAAPPAPLRSAPPGPARTAHLPGVAPHFLMYFFCFVLEGRL